MPAPTVGYGSTDKPFTEAFGRIIEVGWGGTVVIVEMPEEFAYIVSNDPASPDFPEIQAFYATDTTIPKADYKDHWYLEPINDPDGRYYTSRSLLYAPIGYEGYPDLEVTDSLFTYDPVGDGAYAPFNSVSNTVFYQQGPDSETAAAAYYDALTEEGKPLYTFLHTISEEGDATRVWQRGVLAGYGSLQFFAGIGLATSTIDPDHSINGVFQIQVPDISVPFCALVYMKHASEVEVFQDTTNFQSGHSPVPAVKLRAYGAGSTPQPEDSPPIARQYFKVDAVTKRLNKYTVTLDPDTGLPVETEATPKWTRTINLASYPPRRDTDTSLGKFNSKGFALPGDPLP